MEVHEFLMGFGLIAASGWRHSFPVIRYHGTTRNRSQHCGKILIPNPGFNKKAGSQFPDLYAGLKISQVS